MYNHPYAFTKHCIEEIELAQFIDEMNYKDGGYNFFR